MSQDQLHMVVMLWWIVLGAVVGSFLNVCIYRLPWEKSLIWPGSHCPACLHAVRAYDNIPILSWMMLRGRCRDCGARFSARYMLVELSTAFLFGLVYWLTAPVGFMEHLRYACHIALLCALIVATFIDLDLQIIPDSVTVPGTLLGILGSTFVPGVPLLSVEAPAPDVPMAAGARAMYTVLVVAGWGMWLIGIVRQARRRHEHAGIAEWGLLIAFGLYLGLHTFNAGLAWTNLVAGWLGWPAWLVLHPRAQGLLTSLIGMLTGAGLIWVVRVLGSAAMKREAMGFGDVTLMAMVGAFLGWQAALVIFFLAPFLGLAVGLLQWLAKGNNVLPYGPYLSLAAGVTLLFWPGLWPIVAARLQILALFDVLWVSVAILVFLPILLLCLRINSRLDAQSVPDAVP